jgi:hypothetical protein
MQTTGEKNNRERALARFGPLTLLLAAVVGVGLAWAERAVLGSTESLELSQEQVTAARKEAEAKIPRLPPDTEARLEAANFPSLPPVSTAVDPSVDRSGISGVRPPGAAAGLVPGTGQKQLGAQPPAMPAVPDLASRVAAWREEYRVAVDANLQRPPRTKIYLLSELSPFGKWGPKGKEDVWFRSSADRSEFAAPRGTQFYDAVLVGIGPDGPVFRLRNGTTRTVKYQVQSVEPSDIQPSATPSPEAAAKSSPKR